MDDTFMSKVFEDKRCTELVLRIILNRDDLIVDHVNCQQDIKNLQGRSIRMDILAHDRKGVMMMPVQILKERDTTAVFWMRILQKQEMIMISCEKHM
jgi:hypothetical protein